ncbi:MAG: DUF2914 domain-containing protein [Gammaproteobacteria bacterium]|nr:DUF2914 domain-containing protein [Gammaproteobacteria bacterium]
MHEFAEEYVANLKPRDERYDTRLGDDFYVATFPNGIKTWIYLYIVNDFTRRQTLGIYPEMPLEQALESLYAARRTRAVEAELAEQGLDGSQLRETEDSPVNLRTTKPKKKLALPVPDKKFLAGALTGVAACFSVAAVAWMMLVRSPEGEVPVLAAVADPVPPSITPIAQSAPRPVAVTTTVQQQLPQSQPQPAAVAKPTLAGAEENQEQAGLGASQQALMRLQQDLAGTLAWAQLTSNVKNGEPTDRLGWIVELQNQPRRVFYFVRLRGMAGNTVTYQWKHEGRLLKEDTVRVGDGWHSPAYSGITITVERLGRWDVEVFGPDGESLGSEQFEARIFDAALLSLR